METLDYIQNFVNDFTGKDQVKSIVVLPKSGSDRTNFIVKTNEQTFIITENKNLTENKSFFYFSEIFSSLNLNTPKILKISEDKTLYIQEFLGENTLSQIIEKEGLSENVRLLVKETLLKLFKLQTKTKNIIDYSQTFEYKEYNYIPILHDLFYFKFMFVDVLGVEYQKSNLINEFYKLSEIIEQLSPKGLMIRDFQARNIIISGSKVYFIDYQSAMYGVLMYDVVSFLYQAKANFPENFRKEMLNFYINLFDNEEYKFHLKTSVMPIRLVRNLQVLGAYGFRGLVQRKEHFLKSIPQSIENLKQTANDWDTMKEFPELFQLIQKIEKI